MFKAIQQQKPGKHNKMLYYNLSKDRLIIYNCVCLVLYRCFYYCLITNVFFLIFKNNFFARSNV